MKIACIGSRTLEEFDDSRILKYTNCCRRLAKEGHTIVTGFALGADMLALDTVIPVSKADIIAIIYLPWGSYNSEERYGFSNTSLRNKIKFNVFDPFKDTEAAQSVQDIHPNSAVLSTAAYSLLARNYLIIQACDKVLALPKLNSKGKPTGGTAHSLKIAKRLNKDIKIV